MGMLNMTEGESLREAAENTKVGNQIMEHVIRAIDSFYPTTEKAMEWLLRFLQADLPSMRPTEFDPLRYEIASFVWHGPPGVQRVSLAEAQGWKTHVVDRLSIPTLDE